MFNNYKSVVFLHANDSTTDFLKVFKELSGNYIEIKPNIKSIRNSLKEIKQLKETSLIVFLGHGHSRGLYSSQASNFVKQIMIDTNKANLLFKNHDILLLSCNSSGFIKGLRTYRRIIGFGNIISSLDEVSAEAELTGQYRDLSEDDINYFNQTYTKAIVDVIDTLLKSKISFDDVPKHIAFKINKEINILLRGDKKNKTEVSRLLFEFRNQMIFKFNTHM